MAGPNLPLLAWRNLWRNRRRTVITLVSITMGLFLALFFTSIQDRQFGDMIDVNARNIGGHVMVEHPDYQDAPSLEHSVKGVADLKARIARDPEVLAVTDRIVGQVMLQTAHDSAGTGFIAYDPAQETLETFGVLDAITSGEPFASADDKGIILGQKLAENLNVELGDKVVLTLMDSDGELIVEAARLKAIARTGSPAFDASLCLLPLQTTRDLLSYGPDEATLIGVFLKDGRKTDAVASRLGELPGAVALTWDQVAPELAGFIAMKVGGGIFMEIVIALLVVASIFNTLFMSVLERLREFGIQLAIGYTPAQLFLMVVFESLWLALSGIIAGLAVFAVPYLLMNQYGLDMGGLFGIDPAEQMDVAGVGFSMVIYAGIYPDHLALILVIVFLATLLAGLYPAWRAGRVEPVEVIKLV